MPNSLTKLGRRVGQFAVGVLLVVASGQALASHDKTDVASLDDGSTYFGEIKSVQFGALNLKTATVGLLSIEWRHVTGLTSKYVYRLTLTNGASHVGSLGTPEEPGHLRIVDASGTMEVDLAEIVAITPIEHGFWQSLTGSLNFGLTYTQASDTLQYSFSGDVTRHALKNYSVLSGRSILNRQESGRTADQHDLWLFLAQILGDRWGLFEAGAAQSNPFQGYDLRLIAGGGAAYSVSSSSKRLLLLELGLVYNREYVADSALIDQNAEALVGISYNRYRLTGFAPSLRTSLLTFTDLSSSARFRAVLNLDLEWTIFSGMSVSLQISDSYDSAPPGENARSNDLTVVTSIGYSF